MAQKKKPSYDIVATTYVKKPTGIKVNGRNQYETVKTYTTNRKETNFGDLKKNLYDASQKANSKVPNSMYVNLGRQAVIHQNVPRKVKNVTVTNKDGTKSVTYFKAVKKS